MLSTTPRIWHWKSHWKVNPHRNTSETTLKSITKEERKNYVNLLITLKYVSYCYSRMVSLFNPIKNFHRYSYPGFSVWFSMSYSHGDFSYQFRKFCLMLLNRAFKLKSSLKAADWNPKRLIPKFNMGKVGTQRSPICSSRGDD